MKLALGGRVPRLVTIILVNLIMAFLLGLVLLLFFWRGARGSNPQEHLYVLGSFAAQGPLLRLVPVEPLSETDPCFDIVEVGSIFGSSSLGEVCPEKSKRVWMGDTKVEVRIDAKYGTPHISIAGLRAYDGDWLGSGADQRLEETPRVPLRSYGVPYRAARVKKCAAVGSVGDRGGRVLGCIEVVDRLGRLAIEPRSGQRMKIEAPLDVREYQLEEGDRLWMGLVAYEVAAPANDDHLFELDRSNDPNRERPSKSPLTSTQLVENSRSEPGTWGDRRWLERLWQEEYPACMVDDCRSRIYEVFPIETRYNPHHLSRQWINLEAEDILQRLIDEEWICLDRVDWRFSIEWRAFERPGCQVSSPSGVDSVASLREYENARYGEVSAFVDRLRRKANTELRERAFLGEATDLPLAFDWGVSLWPADERNRWGRGSIQPSPTRLWGVRFGSARLTRQERKHAERGQSRLGIVPDVVARDSTTQHLMQWFESSELRATFSFVRPDRGPASICLGRAKGGQRLEVLAGMFHPLGAVAIDGRLRSWFAQPSDLDCAGCRLNFRNMQGRVAQPGLGEQSEQLAVEFSGNCDELVFDRFEDPLELKPEDEIRFRSSRLRYFRRSTPAWIALSDPVTNERIYSRELYSRARLEPVLGNELGGLEKTLRQEAEKSLHQEEEVTSRQEAEQSWGKGGKKAVEITVDGDLQLAAVSIVEASIKETEQGGQVSTDPFEITAVVLDAESGHLLAVVNPLNMSAKMPGLLTPSRWELAARTLHLAGNQAFRRRWPVGSTFKIAGAYALVNNAMRVGSHDAALTFEEPQATSDSGVSEGSGGQIFLVRGDNDKWFERRQERHRHLRRRCAGRHHLPRIDRAFTTGLFEDSFSRSCNAFFLLTGIRYAGPKPLELVMPPGPRASDEIALKKREGELVVALSEDFSIAEHIRQGLKHDIEAGDEKAPRSLFGILTRLGFRLTSHSSQPGGESIKAEVRLSPRGRPSQDVVVVPAQSGWFPSLTPWQHFEYPTIEIPGVTSRINGSHGHALHLAVSPDARYVSRPEVTYAMEMIGQGRVAVSALSLATLFAPAARVDGRAVTPCLLKSECRTSDALPRVLDVGNQEQMKSLDRALRSVLTSGTASSLSDLAGRWGGKTGTYQLGKPRWRDSVGISEADWQGFVRWACGVDGQDRPDMSPLLRYLRRKPTLARGLQDLEVGGHGAGRGAVVCEEDGRPLNPAGLHGYQATDLPESLDAINQEVRPRPTSRNAPYYYGFVAVGLPSRSEGQEVNPVQGIVIAVLVDELVGQKKNFAVGVARSLAEAVERWAIAGGRQ